jgi:hypothetical protein
MQTDRILVFAGGVGTERAMQEAEKYASYVGLDQKQELHLRLLTEETLGMVKAITGEFKAYFWIENIKENGYKIHLDAEIKMDYEKKQDLISVSKSQKNAASQGFMGKVRDMMENGIYQYNEAGMVGAAYGVDPITYTSMGISPGVGHAPLPVSEENLDDIATWSMEQYKEDVKASKDEDPDAAAAWDVLEKSIVASIADDVIVYVRKNKAQVTIVKYL